MRLSIQPSRLRVANLGKAAVLQQPPTRLFCKKGLTKLAAPISALTPTSTVWSSLTAHVNQWFYQPDTEALEVALTAACAHYIVESDPVWLFVIGPSSSGKTAIIINALRNFPNTHIMGDITTKTLISHAVHAKEAGLLHHIGSSGMLLFKDFTTLISKREDEKKEIASQLREVYDGEYKRNSGNDKNPLWKGKITTIAACTPALERSWGMMRELGERFVTVRWPRIGGTQMARAAAQQRGRENSIALQTAELGRKLFDCLPRHAPEPLPDALAERCAALSEIVCNLRANVTRDSRGDREIIAIPDVEEPGRINKSLEVLATTHAQLWHRVPTEDDFRIAHRVGMDCVTSGRRAIFDGLRAATGASITHGQLASHTGIPFTTVEWIAEELMALHVIEMNPNATGQREYKFTPKIKDLLEIVFTK